MLMSLGGCAVMCPRTWLILCHLGTLALLGRLNISDKVVFLSAVQEYFSLDDDMVHLQLTCMN